MLDRVISMERNPITLRAMHKFEQMKIFFTFDGRIYTFGFSSINRVTASLLEFWPLDSLPDLLMFYIC